MRPKNVLVFRCCCCCRVLRGVTTYSVKVFPPPKLLIHLFSHESKSTSSERKKLFCEFFGGEFPFRSKIFWCDTPIRKQEDENPARDTEEGGYRATLCRWGKKDFLFFPRDMNAHAERERLLFFFQHHGQLRSERALFFCGAVRLAERFSFNRGETH